MRLRKERGWVTGVVTGKVSQKIGFRPGRTTFPKGIKTDNVFKSRVRF